MTRSRKPASSVAAPTSPAQHLAQLARRTLARPQLARLVVEGMGPDGPDGGLCAGVELVDRAGTPVLACERGSVLEAAGREGRTATLSLAGPDLDPETREVVESGGRPGPTIWLHGRLAPAGTELVSGREVALVEIELVTVRVAGGAGRAPADVDLAAYRADGGPDLVEYAALVLAHTNTDHERDLIGFVADLCGSGPDDVAGARLTALDPTGIAVRWVDLDGAHDVRVLFPHRARCAEQLAGLLQQTLCTHC